MTEEKRVIKWGIIGCGDVTEVKSGPAYQKTKGFEIVSVMRRDLNKLKDYAKRHKITKYSADADDLIYDDDIDAIYIATPPDVHMHYALKVADAGKICCIEKPMAPNYHESLAIYNAFSKKKLPLFIAYYRRTLPRFTKIHDWLNQNYIGDIRHISWYLSKTASETDLSKAYNWRTDAKVAPAGYFDDLASHGLDLFTYYLGNIKDVKGFSLNQQKLYTAKDAITASWIHENGITGSGFWNFGCHKNLDEVTIFGSKGTISFSVFQENPIVLQSDTKNETLVIEHPEHVQMHHVEGMRDMLINKDYTHPSMGESGLHTSWVMDKILGAL